MDKSGSLSKIENSTDEHFANFRLCFLATTTSTICMYVEEYVVYVCTNNCSSSILQVWMNISLNRGHFFSSFFLQWSTYWCSRCYSTSSIWSRVSSIGILWQAIFWGKEIGKKNFVSHCSSEKKEQEVRTRQEISIFKVEIFLQEKQS